MLLPFIVSAGVLGAGAGFFACVLAAYLPMRMERAWRRDARELLGVEPDADIGAGRSFREELCRPLARRWPVTAAAVVGAASSFVAWRFGPGLQCLAALLVTWVLAAAACVDLRAQLLPDAITLPLLWLGLLGSLVPTFVSPGDAVLGAAIGYAMPWAAHWATKITTGQDGFGYGDFKLLAAGGAWLGPTLILLVAVGACVTGVAGRLVATHANWYARREPMPFGPFLAACIWAGLVSGGWSHAAPLF